MPFKQSNLHKYNVDIHSVSFAPFAVSILGKITANQTRNHVSGLCAFIHIDVFVQRITLIDTTDASTAIYPKHLCLTHCRQTTIQQQFNNNRPHDTHAHILRMCYYMIQSSLFVSVALGSLAHNQTHQHADANHADNRSRKQHTRATHVAIHANNVIPTDDLSQKSIAM